MMSSAGLLISLTANVDTGVAVAVGSGVGVLVTVDVGVWVLVGIGVLVKVGRGVDVGSNTCSGLQPETTKLNTTKQITANLQLLFIILLQLSKAQTVALHRQPADDDRLVEKLISQFLDVDYCFEFV